MSPMKNICFCLFALSNIVVCAAGVFGGSPVPGMDGGIWPDNNGVHVNAHGGCVLAYGGRYWWYG